MANGDKIEKMLKALAADVGSIKRDMGEMKRDLADVKGRQYRQLADDLGELTGIVRNMQSDHAHLASAVGVAISQLALAQSIVKRLDRLEAAVFPAKH